MKAKLKFNKAAIQKLLLAHVEKFGFALVILCLVFILMGAMGRSGYEKTPTELTQVATEKGQLIDSTPEPPPGYVGTPVRKAAERIRYPVNAISYPMLNRITEDIWKRRAKRTEPLLFPVGELRGTAGHGGIRVMPNEANPGGLATTVTGQRWVVLTGLIPYEKQFQAYVDAFQEAEGFYPERDVPQIIYFRLERAELDSPGEAGQGEWEPVELGARFSVVRSLAIIFRRKATLSWNGVAPEMVFPKYIHQAGATPIAFPLPPLNDTAFGREVAHHPDIPLAIEDVLSEEELKALEEELAAEVDDGPPMVDVPPDERLGMIEREVIEVDPEPYRLFRFFDFQVEPGKFYQYRVKLMLINPNYDVERQYLTQDDLRVAKYLETDWSEATEIVSVPRDARVLLGSVKPTPRDRVTMEPKASVGISFFYYDRGAQLYERHDVVRGMYLNFPGHELPANLVPVEETVPGQGLLGLGLGGASKKTDEPEPVTVDFNTEHILLDMMGGERLPGRDRNLVSPGKMLLFDPSGNLVVKDELEDKPEYDLSDPDLKPAASNAPGGLFSDEEDYDMEEMEEDYEDDY